MKKALVIAAFLLAAIGAKAQVFDFSSNRDHYEADLYIGVSGFGTPRADWGLGGGLSFWGAYVGWVKAGPRHRYAHTDTGEKWNDKVATTVNLGYQIPILNWLRLTPVLGYCQTNEGITDGSKVETEYDDDSWTLYHPYKVTRGSREHYFNYGLGLSVQPIKWVSLKFFATRYAMYGGISITLEAF